MKFFSSKKEETIVLQIAQLLDLLCNSCEHLRTMLIKRTPSEEIGRMEREADEIRRSIIKILNEAFLPYLRPHIYKLVDTIDDAIDAAKDAEESFKRLIKKDVRLIENFQDDLINVAEISLKMCQTIRSYVISLLKGSKSREEVLAILILEKRIDDIRAFVLDEISKLDRDFWAFKLFLDFFENLVKVSDSIEEACDVAQIISFSL